MIIKIPFAPIAKRAHTVAVVKKGGRSIPIVSDPDRELKKDIAQFIADNCGIESIRVLPFSGPVAVTITAHFLEPETQTRKQKEFRNINPYAFDKKVDLDNIAKFYLDVLQTPPLAGRIFADGMGGDALVVDLRVKKFWVEDQSGVTIQIERAI
jgi:Holliday junction resolvase RusA-like endonuclease